nr:putative wax ester synthase/acyl-CoA:diacylglycerol acyltransferase [uncultured bacterium]
MTGPDATMLYIETPAVPMHTLKIAVLDPSCLDGVYDRARLVEELRHRLPLLEPFRRRIVPVPFGLHHPMWIEDPDFDIERHVHAMEVDAPGGPRELDAAISTIHSRPLARDRPLWEVTLITGLADGRVAVAAKIHHALADGMAAVAALAHVASTEPDELPVVDDGWSAEPLPRRPGLLAHAFADRVTSLAQIPELLNRSVSGARRARSRKKELEDLPPAVLTCPQASFNGHLTAGRRVATAKFLLADFKAVKKAAGCTINDVLLAVTAGALNRYFDQRDEAHDATMTCAIPISIDGRGAEPRRSGNRVGQLFTSLRTDIEDPAERLARIHAVTKNAKLLNAELGPELSHDWNEYASNAPYQFLWRAIVPRVKRPPVNIVVANVPGPTETLYFAGAEMTDFYSASVLTEGIACNLTVWSYLDHLYAGLTTCTSLLPDPHAITDAMPAALEELILATA